MTRFETAIVVAPRAGAGQDRVYVREVADGVVLALADGAGGTGNGARAAELAIEVIAARDRADWVALFDELDVDPRLAGGQTTAVVVHVRADEIRGASVGDSGAWIVGGGLIDDLTEAQVRKPLVGSGCHPVAFVRGALDGGTLVLASDGLFAYAPREAIVRVVSGTDLAVVARDLVELVRLRSGALPDDVSIVLCRGVTDCSGDDRAS